MAKKKPSFIRTTISVAADLKRRMDKVTEDVNWSGLACRAFEGKLAEISSRKQEKDMSDVITRLRESKRQNDTAATAAGREAGERWVKEVAEVAEIQRLEAAWDSLGANDQWTMFSVPDGNAYSAGECLVFTIQPDNDGVRQAAEEFWDFFLGDNIEAQNDAAFMEGFITGALDLWQTLKGQL